MKLIIAAILIGLTSCSTQKHLRYTGEYRIAERKGDTTKLEGVKGTYLITSDTLKKGDVIKINVIKIR
jgi:hypothetical protein